MRSGPRKTAKNKKKKEKKYSGQQQKEIDCDEPHSAPNEKTQPIQWTERPIGALVAVNSLWPQKAYLWQLAPQKGAQFGELILREKEIFVRKFGQH